MMNPLAKLFGKSPFAPLQAHMEKVAACMGKLEELFDFQEKGEQEPIEALAHQISKLEHAADLAKNNIRNHLPNSLFLAMDRSTLLDILALQDSLADKAEDIANLLTYRTLAPVPELEEDFRTFVGKNLGAFRQVHEVIRELHELLESSFGGSEAEKVKGMIEDVAFNEHEVDLLQKRLLKGLFRQEHLPVPVFCLWWKLFGELASISDIAEKLANRVRMSLEIA